MRSLKVHLFGFAILALVVGFALPAWSDTTQVLPKGRSSVNLSYFTDSISRQFDDAGADRELGYQLDHVNITGVANAVLQQQIGPIPFNILDSAVTFLTARADVNGYAFSYQYGITDKLTVGIGLPYFNEARSRATFGVDVRFSAPAIGAGLDTLILANTTPEAMVQNYLHQQLGYKKIKNWERGTGPGDVLLGAKYRFLDTANFKSAASGFVSIPAGQVDDERNLMDIAYGSGCYSTGIELIADVIPVNWLTWSLSGGYTWDLPYDRGVFLLDKSNPTFYNAEFPTLHQFGAYNRGNSYNFQTDLSVEPAPGLRPYVAWRYMQSETDKIDDDLMPKTARIERKLIIGLSASSVENYLQNKKGLPMIFDIYAEPVQSGKNVTKDAQIFASVRFIF